MKPIVKRAVEIARSQEGVREEGENRGPKINEYLRSVGLGPGYPWCAAFTYWSIQQATKEADTPNPFLRTASTGVMRTWADEHDILEKSPEPGDVFLRGDVRSNGAFVPRHCGFVVSVNGAEFATIEGNTNIGGSPEGIGVFKRKRNNSNNYRFVRWSALLDEPKDDTYALFVKDKKVLDMPLIGGRALCPVREWGKYMGFKVEWNNANQSVLFDGEEVDTTITLIKEKAYAPIRDLARSAGMQLKVDMAQRKVVVF